MRSGSSLARRCRVHSAHDEYHRVGVGVAELRGHAQGGHRGVAAHEPQVVALHPRAQLQLAGDQVLRPRSEEARARHGDDVRHVGRLDASGTLHCPAGRLYEDRPGLNDVVVVARLRARREQLAGLSVVIPRILAGRTIELGDHRAASLNTRHPERRRHDALAQAAQPLLLGEYFPDLALIENGRG